MAEEPDPALRTTVFHTWVDRLRAGDDRAADELLSQVAEQLEQMARRMLQHFPSVARWEESSDVLQNAMLRLLRALKEVRPESVRAFFALAATQMRRELIDLARHYHGPHGQGAHHASVVKAPGTTGDSLSALDPAEPAESADELARWTAFHQAVEELPAEEREIVGLMFYQGWSQVEIAQLLQSSERTVRRRWQSACRHLRNRLRKQMPPLEDE